MISTSPPHVIMTVKPTLAYLKAQISRLGLSKKEELLEFLTNHITEQKATGQKPKEASIDHYVKYYTKFIPKEDTILMEGIDADLTTLGLKSSNINKNNMNTHNQHHTFFKTCIEI